MAETKRSQIAIDPDRELNERSAALNTSENCKPGSHVAIPSVPKTHNDPILPNGSQKNALPQVLLLFFLCLTVYNANLRQIGAADTLSARYLPFGIWRYGTVELGPIARWVRHGHPSVPAFRRSTGNTAPNYCEPSAYWTIETDNHRLVSTYPIIAPLLVTPLYAPAVAYLAKHGWEQPHVDHLAEIMEKFSASVLAASATVLVYLVLRRDAGRWSLPFALAFGFATNTWMISSQALWQHGAGEFLIALGLWLTVTSPTPMRLALLGGVSVFIAANRPPDILIAGAFLVYAAWMRWRNIGWLLAGAALPLSAVLFYNVGLIGSIAGGYGVVKTSATQFFNHSSWSGIAGLLVSPGRGLLVFSPFLIFLPIGLTLRLRAPETRLLTGALSLAVIAQLFVYSRADWRAGMCWGPRWLTDTLPVLIWLLAPAPLLLRLAGRRLLVLMILISTAVQTIGAFWYDKTSDRAIVSGATGSKQNGAWKIANTQFIADLRHPPARPELTCKAEGFIDHIGLTTSVSTKGDPPLLEPGSTVEGWAIACGRKPAALMLLIDGAVIGSTGHFVPRPDVHATNPAYGWRVVANMHGIGRGEHTLQVAVKINPTSDIRIVQEKQVIAVPPNNSESPATSVTLAGSPAELEAAAQRATAALKERQSDDGYWLTSYTAVPRFENPQPEMNTFLTSMLVDLLSPIADQHNLSDLLLSARDHLRAQIEEDGLVRYHGLPTGKTIGKLGCVITPDADDTALVWRIAPPSPNDSRRQRMLETLARYQNERGLYRTWLASTDQYQCLNPGRDPNPADLVIQMNVYLMLREVDPAAAANLCRALQQAINDENVWVYYADAPLIPFLRCGELRQHGCDLPLPLDRISRVASEQDIWSEVVRSIVDLTSGAPTRTGRDKIRNLLSQISRENFALVQRNPPLLYHNDLTASVKRYYWSEDFGYALWLRLYNAIRAEAGSAPRSSP